MYRLTGIVFQIERRFLSSSKLYKNPCNAFSRDYGTKLKNSPVVKREHRNRSESFPTLLLWGGLFSVFQRKEEPELIEIIKRAKLLMQNDEMRKAEQMLHIALKLAQEQQNVDGIVYVLDHMANVAYHLNENVKANKLFVSVLQHLLSQGVPHDDNRILHISLKLADMYLRQGERWKAEEGYKFCLEALEKKFNSGVQDEDTVMLYGTTLDWYALFAVESGRYKEAHDLFKKAYDLAVNINGETSEQAVIFLSDLGTVSFHQGDFDAALKYLEQAAAVGKKLPDVVDLGSVYVNMGNVYLKKQMLAEAKRYCMYARKEARRFKNKEVEHEADICLEEIKLPQTA